MESTQITLGEALPEGHLARFIVGVVGLLDLSEIYGEYSERGAPQGHPPYAPEVLLALLLYGFASSIAAVLIGANRSSNSHSKGG